MVLVGVVTVRVTVVMLMVTVAVVMVMTGGGGNGAGKFYVNLTQVRAICEEKTSTEKNVPSILDCRTFF